MVVAIRWILGRIILLLNFVFTPWGVKRDQEQQQLVNAETAKLTLYQFHACPFCVKVRRQIKRSSLKIELMDAKAEGQAKTDLVSLGGKHKVPCLRIEKSQGDVEWLYESSAINQYLIQEFGSQ